MFGLEKDGKQYVLAFKESRVAHPNDDGVLAAANEFLKRMIISKDGRVPILVVVGVVSPNIRHQLTNSFKNLVIVDIQNLLYMVHGNEELRSTFVSQLLFSVEGMEPVEPNFNVSDISTSSQWPTDKPITVWDEEIRVLRDWEHKNDKGTEYEKVCVRVLKRLFADDLGIWEEQETTDDSLFRFDLICKIKCRGKEFWDMAEQYFHSKYIVFEFKDYSKAVTQKEIFTTVKYLYAKALRCVAIMFSPVDFDDHAKIAIRGILREEGKLILALTNEDLIKMLRKKRDGDDPADHLSEKLDELLIHLDK